MSVHHCTYEAELVLAKIEHAELRILSEHSHNNDSATLLDGFHKRTDRRLDAGNLKSYLVSLVTEEILDSLCKWNSCNIESVLDAALSCDIESVVAYVSDKNLLCTSCDSKLCYKITDCAGT